METLKPQEAPPEPSPFKLKWSEMGLWIIDTNTGQKTLAGEAGNISYPLERQVHFLREEIDGQDMVLILSQSRPSRREKENTVPANSPIELSSTPGAKVLELGDFLPSGFVYDCRVLNYAARLIDPNVSREEFMEVLDILRQPVLKDDGKMDEEQTKANLALADLVEEKISAETDN